MTQWRILLVTTLELKDGSRRVLRDAHEIIGGEGPARRQASCYRAQAPGHIRVLLQSEAGAGQWKDEEV